jgi:PAS domain S-box-containing protein
VRDAKGFLIMAKKTTVEISKPQSLLVLMVEDSEDDALLIVRALKKGGYDLVYERVETAADMRQALEDKTWDIILSDYKMPHFSGPKAIALLVETKIDIPLIIVSGTIGEETAVECMRLGAHDFFVKDKLTRLCAAVERELSEAQSRKKRRLAEQAAIASELRFKELFEYMSSCVAVFEAAADGTDFFFKDFNRAAEIVEKIERRKVIGKSVQQVFPGVREMGLLEAIQRVWKTGTPKHYPAAYYKDKRNEGWRESFLYKLPTGEVVVLYNDVSERINAERKIFESEEKYRMLVENSSETILIAQDGMLKFANKASQKLLAVSNEVLTSTPFPEFIYPEDREMVLANHLRRLKGETLPEVYPFRIIAGDGSIKWVELHATLISWREKPATLNFLTDITDRRKSTEILRLSELKFRRLFEQFAIGAAQLEDRTGKIVELNQKLCDITGYSKNELLAETFETIIHPDDISANVAEMTRLREGQTREFSREGRCRHKDGSFIWVHLTVSALWSADEEATYYIALVKDITERKQAEEALRETQKQLIEAHRLAHIGIWNWIAKTDVTTWSEELYLIAGLDPLPPAPRYAEHSNLYTQESWNILKEAVERAINTGETYQLELQLIRPNGTTRWVNSFGGAQYDQDGRISGLHGTVQDITESKIVEESLRQSEEKYRTLVENINDVIFTLDLQGKFTFVSNAIKRISGYTPSEVEGLYFSNFIHPDDLSGLAEAFKQTLSGIMATHEFRVLDKTGAVRWVITRSKLVDENMKSPVITGIMSDITERKQAEENLIESKSLIETVVENVPLMIFLKEATDLRFVIFNRAGEELLGYDRKDLLGKNNLDLFPPEQAVHFMAKDREVLDGKAGMLDIPEEFIQTAKKGQRLLHTRKVCIRSADGATKYLLGISEDITERKKTEEELRVHHDHLEELVAVRTTEIEKINTELITEIRKRKEIEKEMLIAKDDAETANRSKSDFLANMSHELRTPLNSVIGFSEVLQNQLFGPLNEKQLEYTQYISGGGKHLLNVINDILDLSKVEAGKMELCLQIFSIKEILNGANLMFSEKALKHRIHTSVEIAADVPAQINADERKVKQIMYNLLSNALKFTPDGGYVKTTAKLDKENNCVVLIVEDTGIGIKADDLPKIFQPFSQIESPYTKTTTGTGLGLAVTKRLVDLHGGTVKMESEWGKGSKVTVTIPIGT